VTGAANTVVTWSVNNITGGNATVGTISASGLYAAPSAVPNPASVTIRATSVATANAVATLSVTQPPGGGVSQGTPNLAVGRFLEQALDRLGAEQRAMGKADLFARLRPELRTGPERGDYETLSIELGIAKGTLSVTLHRLQQRYRELVRGGDFAACRLCGRS
jgi:hypothetical protein